jgi:hypothetical protein
MHLATVSDVVKVADRLHVAPGRAPLDNTYTARVVHSVRAEWCRGQAKTWAAQAPCQSRKAPGPGGGAGWLAVGGARGFCSLVAAGRSCLQLAGFEHWHMPSFTPTLFMYQPGHHHPTDPDVSATSGGWRGPRHCQMCGCVCESLRQCGPCICLVVGRLMVPPHCLSAARMATWRW